MTTERWALVPVEATPEMLTSSGPMSGWNGNPKHSDRDHVEWWDLMIASSPGAELLAEVLAARDALRLTPNGSHEEDEALYRLLAALDKLGPAVEGET